MVAVASRLPLAGVRAFIEVMRERIGKMRERTEKNP